MKIKHLYIILGTLVCLTVSVFIYFFIQNRSIFDQMPVFAASREIKEMNLLYTFGNGDSKENNLRQPLDLAIDSLGKAYVLDNQAQDIKVYDPNGSFLFSFGNSKDQTKSLVAPAGIAIHDNQVLVTEPSAGKIQAFTMNGEYIRPFFTSPKNGKYSPVGLAEDADGNVLFTDVAGHRIVELDAEGKEVSTFGEPGRKDGQFAYPHDLTIDDDGRIYVADSNNGRIQVFDRKGTFITKIDGTKEEKPKFSLPRGITIDEYKRLLVIDTLANQVRFFELTGEPMFEYGELGAEDGQFSFPNGVAVDGKKIFITDRENHRVQVFTVE